MKTRRVLALFLSAVLLLSVFSAAVSATDILMPDGGGETVENADLNADLLGIVASECSHPSITSDNKCTECGKAMKVRLAAGSGVTENFYFETLENAIDAIPAYENPTLYLLDNITVEENITVTNTDLKIYGGGNITFTAGKSLIVGSGTTAYLEDNNLGNTISAVTVENGGMLRTNSTLMIEKLVIKEGGSAELLGGKFGEIDIQSENITLGDILTGSHKFRRIADDTWISDGDAALDGKTIQNVKVEKAPFQISKFDPSMEEGNVVAYVIHISADADIDPHQVSQHVTRNGVPVADSLSGYGGGKAYAYRFSDSNVPVGKNEYVFSITYKGFTAQYTHTYIYKGISSVISAPTAKADLVYLGEPQELLESKGTASGGEMQFSLDGTNYSADIPKATEVGEYTVYYKVAGDETHYDSEPQSITVTIGKCGLTYLVYCNDKYYDGTTTATVKKIVFIYGSNQDVQGLVEGRDYIINSVAFESPEVNDIAYASASVSLIPGSDGDKHYYFKDEGASRGRILKGTLEGCHDATVYIRYDDTSLHEFDPSIFGAALDCTLYSDGVIAVNWDYVNKSNTYEDHVAKKIYVQLKEGLSKDITKLPGDGSCFWKWVGVVSADGRYISRQPDGRENAKFTVRIVEKLPPEITAQPISVEYDSEPVSIDDITYALSATMYGEPVSGTWSFKDSAPTNCADSGLYTVVFTPTDSTLYETVEKAVDIQVTQRNIGRTYVSIAEKDFTYNGTEQKPTVIVSQNRQNTMLYTEGVDYNVYYKPDFDGVNVGFKNFQVIGMNNLTGSLGGTYLINPNTDMPQIELSESTFIYDGSAKTPTAVVTSGGRTLVDSVDYELSYESNTNVGTARVIVNGKGNYGFTNAIKEFTINKADSSVAAAPTAKADLVYNGQPQELLESVGTALNGEMQFSLDGTNYSADIPKGEDAKPYTVYYKVKGDANHNDSAAQSIHVNIGTKDIAGADITLGDALIFNRAEQEQTVNRVVTTDGLEATFAVSNNKATNAGTYRLTVTGTGNFSGIAEKEFAVSPKSVQADIEIRGAFIYSGAAIEPTDMTVKDGEAVLVKDTDYTVSYDNNVNAGTAKVKVAFIGNYAGAAEKEFTILPKTITPSVTIARPVVSARPQTSAETAEYTATVSWTPSDSPFTYNTVYTAKISITPKANYTLSGIAENGVTVSGAESVTNAADSGEITAVFAKTPRRSNGGGATRYPIYFETNGGSAVATQFLKKGEKADQPKDPEKKGFTFAGWYTDMSFATKYDFSTVTEDAFTLYAAWTPDASNAIVLTIGEKTASVFGKTAENDVAPKIVNSRTMLPARFIAENLGAKVDWNEEKQQVTITGKHVKTGESLTILLTIGESKAIVNEKEIALDAATFVENDRTYTPVRFISECLGADVEWFEALQQVYIIK